MDSFLNSSLKKSYTRHEDGYVALLSVFLVGAVSSILVAISLTISIFGAQDVAVSESSEQARNLATGCAEVLLNELRLSGVCFGSEVLNTSLGSCTVSATSDGSNCVLQSTGTAGDSVRRVEVTLGAVTPAISLSAWQEVADF